MIDSSTKQLQKFDPAGNFLAAVDIRGELPDPADGSEPWGLGIAPNGNVVVADTFGWKVRVFDADLQADRLTFGQPPARPPKRRATTTSSARATSSSMRGQLLGHRHRATTASWSTRPRASSFARLGGTGSGENQFDEPVGLSLTADGTSVLVADMYNSRVVILDADERPANRSVHGRRLGRPGRHRQAVHARPAQWQRRRRPPRPRPGAHLHDRRRAWCRLLAATQRAVIRPYGLVETADGKLWVVEGGSTRVRLFDIP